MQVERQGMWWWSRFRTGALLILPLLTLSSTTALVVVHQSPTEAMDVMPQLVRGAGAAREGEITLARGFSRRTQSDEDQPPDDCCSSSEHGFYETATVLCLLPLGISCVLGCCYCTVCEDEDAIEAMLQFSAVPSIVGGWFSFTFACFWAACVLLERSTVNYFAWVAMLSGCCTACAACGWCVDHECESCCFTGGAAIVVLGAFAVFVQAFQVVFMSEDDELPFAGECLPTPSGTVSHVNASLAPAVGPLPPMSSDPDELIRTDCCSGFEPHFYGYGFIGAAGSTVISLIMACKASYGDAFSDDQWFLNMLYSVLAAIIFATFFIACETTQESVERAFAITILITGGCGCCCWGAAAAETDKDAEKGADGACMFASAILIAYGLAVLGWLPGEEARFLSDCDFHVPVPVELSPNTSSALPSFVPPQQADPSTLPSPSIVPSNSSVPVPPLPQSAEPCCSASESIVYLWGAYTFVALGSCLCVCALCVDDFVFQASGSCACLCIAPLCLTFWLVCEAVEHTVQYWFAVCVIILGCCGACSFLGLTADDDGDDVFRCLSAAFMIAFSIATYYAYTVVFGDELYFPAECAPVLRALRLPCHNDTMPFVPVVSDQTDCLPFSLEGGYVNRYSNHLKNGSVVQVTCDEGFVFVGCPNSQVADKCSLVCQDSAWIPSAAACARIGCDGVVDSGVEKDACEVCGGNNSTCLDCAGVPNGKSFLDRCNSCVSSNVTACVRDCSGIWGGEHVIDACGQCGGDGSGCLGCDGVPNSGLVVDACGECGGDSTACADCQGTPNGAATYSCGICDDDPTNDCADDCFGTQGGAATLDACGVCAGDGSTCAAGRVPCDAYQQSTVEQCLNNPCTTCHIDIRVFTSIVVSRGWLPWNDGPSCVLPDGESAVHKMYDAVEQCTAPPTIVPSQAGMLCAVSPRAHNPNNGVLMDCDADSFLANGTECGIKCDPGTILRGTPPHCVDGAFMLGNAACLDQFDCSPRRTDCGTIEGTECTDSLAPNVGYTCSCADGYTGESVANGIAICTRSRSGQLSVAEQDGWRKYVDYKQYGSFIIASIVVLAVALTAISAFAWKRFKRPKVMPEAIDSMDNPLGAGPVAGRTGGGGMTFDVEGGGEGAMGFGPKAIAKMLKGRVQESEEQMKARTLAAISTVIDLTADQQRQLEEEMRRNGSEQPDGVENFTFANSEFKDWYEDTPVPTDAMILGQALLNLVQAYCDEHAIPYHNDGPGFRFGSELRKEMLGNAEELSNPNVIPMAAQRLWTSTKSLPTPDGRHVEFCSVLNQALRSNKRKYVEHTAVLARGINQLCVSESVNARVEIKHPPQNVCYRGGGFSEDNAHRQFFAAGKKFRQPAYLATSWSKDVTQTFINRSTASAKVLWTIHIDPQRKCKHVNLVVKTHVEGEKEYLFAPFSVFTVLEADWRAGTSTNPHSIELLAAVDNREEPEDLPLAPWS